MKPLLFTDDFSRSRLRPAFLAAAVKWLLRRELLRAAGDAGTLVSSADLEDDAVALGLKFMSYGSVMLQGVKDASVVELIPFLEFLRTTIHGAYRFRSRDGACAGDVLAFRHFTPFLHEYLVKPIVSLGHVLDQLAPERVQITSCRSDIETMVELAAKQRGIEVSVKPAGFALRLASWGKGRLNRRAFVRHEDEEMRRQWKTDYGFPLPALEGYDVVLVCDEERRLNRAVELVGRLREAGRKGLIIAVPFKAEALRRARAIRESGVDIAFVSDFLPDAEVDSLYDAALADAHAAWQSVDQHPSTREFRFEGVAIWERFGRNLQGSWSWLNIQAAFAIRAAESCFDRVHPRQVILVGNAMAGKAFQETAKARGITTIWYCDNPILANVRFWPEVMPRFLPTDAVIATSSFLAESLVERYGYPKERVFLLGESQNLLPAAATCSFQLPPSSRPRVLVLSAYVAIDVSARRRRQFHELAAAAAREAGYDLVVRAHPNESFEGLRADLAEWGITPVFLSQRENIQEVLSQVQVACMIFSQAGLEVLRAGKPLVVIQSPAESEAYESFIPYVGSGSALFVNADEETAKQAAAKLRECVENPEPMLERGQKFFRHYSTASFDPSELQRFAKFLA